MQHRTSPFHNEEAAYDTGHSSPSDPHSTPTRELTLGTATILGLFFALALVCAVCFGFGYSLGSRHNIAASATAAPSGTSALFTAKPAPGSLAAAPAPSAPPLIESVTVPATPAHSAPTPAAANPSLPEPTETTPRPADPTPDPHPLPAAAQPIVQVAAVSHQEDAELIASTLKRRGYAVLIRSEPQDKLLHLQLGPFPTKKDAEAMRQRLLADGFNAYIK